MKKLLVIGLTLMSAVAFAKKIEIRTKTYADSLENSITIVSNKKDKPQQVAIFSMALNKINFCEFESDEVKKKDNVITAKYNDCVVTITLNDNGSVSSVANDDLVCDCGAGASLTINNATLRQSQIQTIIN